MVVSGTGCLLVTSSGIIALCFAVITPQTVLSRDTLLLSGVQYRFDKMRGMRAPDAIHWSYFWNFNPSLL